MAGPFQSTLGPTMSPLLMQQLAAEEERKKQEALRALFAQQTVNRQANPFAPPPPRPQAPVAGFNAPRMLAAPPPRPSPMQAAMVPPPPRLAPDVRSGPPAPTQAQAQAQAAPAAFPTFDPAGGQITSQFRTPEHNKKVGGVANSWHTRGSPEHPMAMDSVPPPGMSMGEHFQRVKARNPGMFVLNEGDHVHVEPRKGADSPAGGGTGYATGPAVRAFQGAAESIGGFPGAPQMDYSGVNANVGLHRRMVENIEAPQSFTYKPVDYPDRPAPKPFEQADMTAADKAFAAGAPKNPFGETPEEQAKQQLKMRRASYWAGLGQAFANFRDGQGLGSLLANAGGAMLSGAMAGGEKVREKLERHDALMSQYQLQASSREGTKATNTANIINQNLTQDNQYASQLWGDQVQKLGKLDLVFENGRARVGKKNPDGTVTYTSTLVDPSQINSVLSSLGGVLERRSGITNQGELLDREAKLSEFKMLLPFAYQDAMTKGDVGTAGNVAATAAVVAANDLVEGNTWQQEVAQLPDGDQRVAKLSFDGWNSVGGVQVDDKTGMPIPGQSISKDQQDRFNNFIQSNLVQQFMETNQVYRLIGGPTREVYTDQAGLPSTGVRSTKQADPLVAFTQAGNRARERQVTRRTSTKGPFGSTSETVKE